MADLVLRGIKGSPLSIDELDQNFININNDIGTKLNASSYTANDVLAKLVTVDGNGSGLDSDTVDGYNATVTANASTVAVRNSSGNLLASTFIGNLTGDVTASNITATTISAVTSVTSSSFIGNLTGNVTGNLTGNINGDVSGDLTGSIILTGTLTANSSVGSSGQVLASRGSSLSPEWVTVDASNTNNTWTGSQTFIDNKFSIVDDVDNTKILNLQLSGITTGTTRTLTIPNESGTIATEAHVQQEITSGTAAPYATSTTKGVVRISVSGTTLNIFTSA